MDWTEEQTFENAKTQFDATKSQCKKRIKEDQNALGKSSETKLQSLAPNTNPYVCVGLQAQST